MTEQVVRSTFMGRFFDAIVPLLSWFVITMPIWLSPFHPAIVAYFIIAFDLYFLYKALSTAYFATLSYRRILHHQKISFSLKVRELPKAKEITHFIIIPHYKEPLHKLESTIHKLTQADYPYKNLYLVLACEKREIGANQKATILKDKFNNFFKDILITSHALKANEVPGKASNQTFAANKIYQYATNKGIKSQDVLITVCDADSLISQNYFSYLTYEFLNDSSRMYHFYWAPVLLYNNFWSLSFFVRIQATLSSILRLAFLSQKDKLIQISTYSTNLWLLKKINFWDVDVIPEDWHVFYQAFFTFGDKIKTVPLYTIINGDAVYSGALLKTSQNRYEQEKRWAWGVSDIGYTLRKFFTTPHISISAKLKRILFLAESHLLWPTSFFILTISASVPPLINPSFKRTVLGFLLPKLSGFILTLSTVMLILYVYLDHNLRKKLNQKTKFRALPFLFIQWFFLPVVSFFFSSLPALEAHTRLLLGKKIKYKVTEKM
ncbi:glycosyltransferase family 2 protein [Candidatus Roizmanbacteria bacterium]|nr:glycosyltransferase family 2 protein [Candidatus Roizmanbacteria bacterium]